MKHLLILWKIFFFVFTIIILFQRSWAEPINIGSISEEPNEEIKKFLPITRYLAKQLQSEGVSQGRVVVAKGIHQMATYIREGKVDLYIDSPFTSIAVSRLSGSKFLLRRWKKGISEYHTFIFVRKDSGINRLDDLKGRMIAFEEPYSSSGYLLPKMTMTQEGLSLSQKRDALNPVGPDEVGYVFSWEDENTMSWVLRKKAAAGAIDNQKYLKEARDSIESLKIIYETLSIPRHIVSYRADLSKKLVDRIKEILIEMDKSEEGRKTLQEFERTAKFDEIPDRSMTYLLKSQEFIDSEFGLE